MSVLVVEDDESVARFLKQALSEAGYKPEVVQDGAEAFKVAQTVGFDLILLDVMLPSLSGFEICRQLRALKIQSPILMITAKDTFENKIEGLDAGADDYIVKPFHLGELLARIRALLRRGNSQPTILQIADLEIDPLRRVLTRSGQPINLSSTEYTLLEYLMRNPGRVLTRAMILEHVWQYDFGGSDNVLNVYMSYLRGKIDKGRARGLIQTVRGVGFRLNTDDA